MAIRGVFGKAGLGLTEWYGSIPALSLIQPIQQVFLLPGRVGRRGLHWGGQDRRVPTELHGRGSLYAGGVGGGLAAAQVLSVPPGPCFRPKLVAVGPRGGPRPGHEVKGFGAFRSTAATGSWREHKIWIGEPGDLWTVFF